MATLDNAIIMVISILIKKSRKKYCWPSQVSFLRLLRTYHKLKICRRTLNYHLKKLQEDQVISRLRRISRGSDGRPHFASTLYFIKKKAFIWMRKQAEFLQKIGFVLYKDMPGKIKGARSDSQAPGKVRRPMELDKTALAVKKVLLDLSD